jgi:transcriptional regulator with XRE-family HTH domain
MTMRALAREAGVTSAHLSRVLRRADYKTPSGQLASRVAVALDLPPDYFAEYREALVIERVKEDARFRDDMYARLTRRAHTPAKQCDR